MIEPVDFEYGESSIGVTLIRDEGESKDCDRMRTLGEGVRGGAMIVAILNDQWHRDSVHSDKKSREELRRS